ncbi:MAG TPA: hypothetical protein VF984_02275 [Actinomycetota bacterium]
MRQVEGSRSSAAAVLAIAGGALAVLGSILTWASASAGAFSVSAKGLDGWEGKVTLVGGGILLFTGVAAVVGSGVVNLRVPAVVGGLLAAGVGIYTALTAQDQVIDGAAKEIAKELGVPIAAARDAVQTTIDAGVLSVSLEIGLYLVIAGGFIGLLAAVMAEMASRRPVAATEVGPGAGLAGWSVPSPPEPGRASWSAEQPPPPPPAGPVQAGSGEPDDSVGNPATEPDRDE